MTGKSGDDLFIPVPVGTLVYDVDTEELIGDIAEDQQALLVAQGGFHGLGNTRFKSSVNRTPRQCTEGSNGERRDLTTRAKSPGRCRPAGPAQRRQIHTDPRRIFRSTKSG